MTDRIKAVILAAGEGKGAVGQRNRFAAIGVIALAHQDPRRGNGLAVRVQHAATDRCRLPQLKNVRAFPQLLRACGILENRS